MRYLGLAVLAVVAVCSFGAAKAEEDCRLQHVATLPIEAAHPGRVIVPGEIDGKPLRLIVDTGSPFSGLAQGVVDRLGIETRIIAGHRPYFPYAGGEMKYYVRTTAFKLGDMPAPRALLFVMPGMQDADGLIGADFFRHFDVEFDFAHNKMNLFLPHRCPGKAVYWTDESSVAVIPFHMNEADPHIRFDIALDGKNVPAVLDTGAPSTTINQVQAKVWFGLDENSPGMTAAKQTGAHIYHFKTLALEGVTIPNPEIFIHPLDLSRKLSDDSLFGMSMLRRFRLYIAYDERKLYVTAADAH